MQSAHGPSSEQRGKQQCNANSHGYGVGAVLAEALQSMGRERNQQSIVRHRRHHQMPVLLNESGMSMHSHAHGGVAGTRQLIAAKR